MKIFAFSDWRIQSIADLRRMVQDEKPDLILYSGDDLERVVPFEHKLYLKTQSNFIEFNQQTISSHPAFRRKDTCDVKNLTLVITSINTRLKDSEFIKEEINWGNVPFFFVNGNDDAIIKVKEDYYHKVKGVLFRVRDEEGGRSLKISETRSKQIVANVVPDGNRFSIRPLLDERDSDDGIYIKYKIRPQFGHFTYKGLKFFGYQCEYGMTSKVLNRPSQKVDIVLSHLPPLGVLDLSARFGVTHIGSSQVLKDLKKLKPKYFICGHSHFWGGKKALCGSVHVINTSSHDRIGSSGKYVIIDTGKGTYFQKEISSKSIAQIRGGRAVIKELHYHGLGHRDEIESLARMNLLSDKRRFIKGVKQRLDLPSKVRDRLASLGWKVPRIVKRISFNPNNCIFLDVETGLANGGGPGKLWLIGVLYSGVVNQFRFPEERKDFVKYVLSKGNVPIVSWTAYDQKAITGTFKISNEWIDACKRVANCVIWHSYQLSSLYNAIFKLREVSPMDGATIGILADHRIFDKRPCSFCPTKDEIVLNAKLKNRQDLIQMYKICQFLWSNQKD